MDLSLFIEDETTDADLEALDAWQEKCDRDDERRQAELDRRWADREAYAYREELEQALDGSWIDDDAAYARRCDV